MFNFNQTSRKRFGRIGRNVLGLVALGTAMLASATNSFASKVTYTGANNGNYNVASNWSSGSLPTRSDTVVIPNGITVVVPVSTTVYAGVLMMGNGSNGAANLTMNGALLMDTTSLSGNIVFNSANTTSTITSNGNIFIKGSLIGAGSQYYVLDVQNGVVNFINTGGTNISYAKMKVKVAGGTIVWKGKLTMTNGTLEQYGVNPGYLRFLDGLTISKGVQWGAAVEGSNIQTYGTVQFNAVNGLGGKRFDLYIKGATSYSDSGLNVSFRHLVMDGGVLTVNDGMAIYGDLVTISGGFYSPTSEKFNFFGNNNEIRGNITYNFSDVSFASGSGYLIKSNFTANNVYMVGGSYPSFVFIDSNRNVTVANNWEIAHPDTSMGPNELTLNVLAKLTIGGILRIGGDKYTNRLDPLAIVTNKSGVLTVKTIQFGNSTAWPTRPLNNIYKSEGYALTVVNDVTFGYNRGVIINEKTTTWKYVGDGDIIFNFSARNGLHHTYGKVIIDKVPTSKISLEFSINTKLNGRDDDDLKDSLYILSGIFYDKGYDVDNSVMMYLGEKSYYVSDSGRVLPSATTIMPGNTVEYTGAIDRRDGSRTSPQYIEDNNLIPPLNYWNLVLSGSGYKQGVKAQMKVRNNTYVRGGTFYARGKFITVNMYLQGGEYDLGGKNLVIQGSLSRDNSTASKFSSNPGASGSILYFEGDSAANITGDFLGTNSFSRVVFNSSHPNGVQIFGAVGVASYAQIIAGRYVTLNTNGSLNDRLVSGSNGYGILSSSGKLGYLVVKNPSLGNALAITNRYLQKIMVIMAGSSQQTISAMHLPNLTINNASGVMLTGNVTNRYRLIMLNGNISRQGSQTFTFDSARATVDIYKGDFNFDPTFIYKVNYNFKGNDAITVNRILPSDTTIIGSFAMNMGTVNTVTLGKNISINDTVTMYKGYLVLDGVSVKLNSTHTLNSAAGKGGSRYSYFRSVNQGDVIVRTKGNTAFVNIPIGRDKYLPASLSGKTASTWRVYLVDKVLDRDDNVITKEAVDYTWFITPTSSVTDAIIKLGWENKDLGTVLPQFDTTICYVSYRATFGIIWTPTSTPASFAASPIPNRTSGLVTLTGGVHYHFVVGSGTAPLPVTLTAFTAVRQRDNSVKLDWTTANELNNDHFEIQRSSDGVFFNVVGMRKGMGTKLTETRYSFLDRPVAAGVIYYRLRQVDFNGEFEYSPIRSITISGDGYTAGVSYYNAGAQLLVLNVAGENGSAAGMVQIINSNGIVVANAQVPATSGVQYMNVDASTLMPGAYIARWMVDGQMRSFRFVKP